MIQKRLLSLIRTSLIDTPVDANLFEGMSVEDWNSLQEYALQQGVSAIAFDGVEKSNMKVPKQALVQWYAVCENIKYNYKKRAKSVRAMLELLKEADVDMLIFKGISLAKLYPNHKAREFGDIDFYTLPRHSSQTIKEAHDVVNKLVEEQGVKIDYIDKHDVFDYYGSHFEHHNYFVGNDSKSGKDINKYLLNLLKEDKGVAMKDGLYYPSIEFNAIFLMIHSTKHLANEGATLKQIIDWGMFLRNIDLESNDVQLNKIKTILEETGWNKGFTTLTAVAERVLGVDFSHFYLTSPNKYLVDKVYNEITNTILHEEKNHKLFVRFYKKAHRLLSRRWVYSEGLIPANFWTSSFLSSLIEHVENPHEI